MKFINLIRNKLKKKTYYSNYINNKLTNISYIVIKNDLFIKDFMKLDISKTYIYNLKILRKIRPLTIFYILYKQYFTKNEFFL